MTKILAMLIIFVPIIGQAQSQDCEIKYLGVNTGQEEAGEPNVLQDHFVPVGLSIRTNSSYETTNVFRLFSMDIERTRTNTELVPIVNIFEITCVTP